jgi:hypothetical protein
MIRDAHWLINEVVKRKKTRYGHPCSWEKSVISPDTRFLRNN